MSENKFKQAIGKLIPSRRKDKETAQHGRDSAGTTAIEVDTSTMELTELMYENALCKYIEATQGQRNYIVSPTSLRAALLLAIEGAFRHQEGRDCGVHRKVQQG